MSDSTSGPRDEEWQDGEARASPEVEVEAFGKQRETPERGSSTLWFWLPVSWG